MDDVGKFNESMRYPMPWQGPLSGVTHDIVSRVMSGRMPITRFDRETRMKNWNAVHS